MRTRIFAASISFNYEADPKSIVTGVKMTLDGQPIAYTASFDEYNRTLNILSAPVEVVDVNESFYLRRQISRQKVTVRN